MKTFVVERKVRSVQTYLFEVDAEDPDRAKAFVRDHSDGADVFESAPDGLKCIDGDDELEWEKDRYRVEEDGAPGPTLFPPVVVAQVAGGVLTLLHWGEVDVAEIDWDNFASGVELIDLDNLETEVRPLVERIPDTATRDEILEGLAQKRWECQEREKGVI